MIKHPVKKNRQTIFKNKIYGILLVDKIFSTFEFLKLRFALCVCWPVCDANVCVLFSGVFPLLRWSFLVDRASLLQKKQDRGLICAF